jgi:DNA-binding CsgD family transcriptional regulator
MRGGATLATELIQTPSATLMLEREPEVAALEATLDAARDGDGRLVVVEGGAGIGKTRLLAEARALAGAADFDVLTARGGELEGEFAFGIVRQLFEPPLALTTPDERLELFSGAAALSASLFAAAPATTSQDGAESSFAMLHGLYWLAANFALRKPTLLVVDDLHWADEPSLQWLLYLARRIEGLPLLLLVATRPPEQANSPTLVAELLADPAEVTIRPGSLGEASAAALARSRFEVEPDPVFTAALHTGSGGNPLFLLALLDALWREEVTPTADEADHVLELGPHAISRGIATRLTRVPAEATALLRAAAILGDRTELSLAATLAGLEAKTAFSAASALVRVDLLRQENPLEFTHPVVRSAVLEAMSAGDRTHAHRRAAESLLELGAPAEQAATYLVRTIPTGDPFVVKTLRQAAQQSLAHGAPEAAVAYLRRVLDEPPERADRGDVLGDLGIAAMHVDAIAAADYLRDALEQLDVTLRPDVVLAYAKAQVLLGDLGRARESAQLLQRLDKRSGYGSRELQERIAAFLITTCQFDPALQSIVAEQWNKLGDHGLDHETGTGLLLGVRSGELARQGKELDRAVDLARRCLASDLINTPDRLELVNPLAALAMAGAIDEVFAAFARVISVAQRRGDHLAAYTQQVWRGLVRYEAGELLAAEEDLEIVAGVPFWEIPTPLAYRAAFVAQILLDRGELDEAQQLLAPACLDDVQIGHHVHFLYARGRVQAQMGSIQPALDDFLSAGEIAASIGIPNPAYVPWRSQAALALRQLERNEEAQELAREELLLSRSWGAPRAVGISLRALALVESGQRGEQLLREAIDVLATSPARLEHARALIDLGAALRRSNRRSEARQLLRQGIELAHQCGATALVTLANEELAATGAHPRTILLSGLDALTASERRVAHMAAGDLSNKEIAQALFVTVKTVEQHLGRVYRKLDINSRRQLGAALAAPAEAATPA